MVTVEEYEDFVLEKIDEGFVDYDKAYDDARNLFWRYLLCVFSLYFEQFNKIIRWGYWLVFVFMLF